MHRRAVVSVCAFVAVAICARGQSPLVVDGSGSHVYYVAADRSVHQMSLTGSTWTDANLTALSQSGVLAEMGVPPAFDSSGNVYYIASDRTVHELALSGGTWTDSNLTALSQSSALAETGVSLGITSAGAVFYIATDLNIHQLSLSGSTWTDVNATATVQSCQSSCSPPAASASPAIYGNSAYYVGADQTIHDLLFFWGWVDESEGKSANPNVLVEADTSPATFTAGYGGALYVATDQTIHQLSLPNGSWVDTNLMTSSQSGTKVEAGTWTAVDTSGDHVYFVATDASVHEISWNGSSWADSTLALPVLPETGTIPVVDGSGNLYLVAADGAIHKESLSGGQWADVNLTAASQSSARAGGTISGTVSNGSGLAGVTVNLSGTKTLSTITDSSGHYSFYVPAGGSYTVTPSLSGHTFSPASQAFNSIATNQTANFNTAWTISGTVTQNGPALAGVTINLSGSSTASTSTDSNGHYSFTVLAGGNYTLTPSLTGFLFTPASQSFNGVTASQTANFTAAPAIGGTLNPQHPAKDFIRMNGRIIAVQSGS